MSQKIIVTLYNYLDDQIKYANIKLQKMDGELYNEYKIKRERGVSSLDGINQQVTNLKLKIKTKYSRHSPFLFRDLNDILDTIQSIEKFQKATNRD